MLHERAGVGSYQDFLRTHTGRKARMRRLYWVCGDEPLLRSLVVQQIKAMADVLPFNTSIINASEIPETEVWAELNQHPLDSEQQRLLIVHDAQRLKHLGRLIEWVKDNQTIRSRSATAIFVSTDGDMSVEEHKEALMRSSSAYVVKCSLPKDETDRLKRCQELITTWGNIDRINAGILAQRVGYDLSEAYFVMSKAALFPNAKITTAAIDLLAPQKIEAEVVWNLIALNKRAAVEALSEIGAADIHGIFGQLSTHVEMLARVNGTLSLNRSLKELSVELDARQQYLRLLLPYARLYPRREAVRRTMLLTKLDAAHMEGAREGLLETLIAAW